MTKLVLRENTKRGGGQPSHWLQALYTFAVPPQYLADGLETFGRLRIINEDHIKAHNGFGFHSHQGLEIFTYVARGEIKHQDSMDNVEILKRGDIQLTSTGTGIRHSEVQRRRGCACGADLGIPLEGFPETEVLYATLHRRREAGQTGGRFLSPPVGSDGVSTDREGDGPAPIQPDVTLWATVLSPNRTVSRAMPSSEGERKAYMQVVQASGFNQGAGRGAHVRVEIGDQSVEMREGDGVFVHAAPKEELRMANLGNFVAEVLLFDVDLH